MGSASRISNYAAAGVAQLISMYSKPRGTLVSLLPVILGISPSAGAPAGGTLVRMTGINFENVSGVTIGGAPCTSLIVGGGIITCYAPAGSTGQQDIIVTGPAGSTTLVGGYGYTVGPPTVLSVSPSSGSGGAVTITGTGFTGATAVAFGALAATTIVVVNSTTITCVAPSGSGSVAVSVTTPAGTGTSVSPVYTYAGGAAPTISSINFSQGTSAGGGANVIITGTNLSGVTAVNGSWAAGAATSSVTPSATSSTSVTFTLPAHAAATGTWSVTSPGGTSGTIAFEYWTPAVLSLGVWSKASYGGAPWNGATSAGSSGSRSFAAGTTSPAVGTAIAGLTPASCTSAKSLVSATTMGSVITASAYTLVALVKVASANAPGASPFNSDAILADTGGGAYCGMGVSTSGIQPYHYNSTDYNGPIAGSGAGYATGTWMLVFGFYDGTNLKVQINGNTPVSLARTSVDAGFSGSSGAIKLNENFNAAGSGGATADYLETALMGATISASDITKWRLYVQQLYGLSV